MSLWFVYSATTYYPWHEIHEAETAEEALRVSGMAGNEPIYVFPYDAVALHIVGDD